jgi:hypothetical protein
LRIADVVESSLRAARVPAQLIAKALSHVEDVEQTYRVLTVSELAKLNEWELWLILIKSLLSPLTKMMRREGYCGANYFLVGGFIALDERVAEAVRRWVAERCRAGLDPCCSSPRCCNLV